MASFSERKGLVPRKSIQLDAVDEPLRNGLWTALCAHYWNEWEAEEYGYQNDLARQVENLSVLMWLHFFKRPVDTLPRFQGGHQISFVQAARDFFFRCKWYEVYDFLEFVAKNGPKAPYDNFARSCNAYLETECAGYRFVDKVIVQVTETHEISEIEEAASNAHAAVRTHIETALKLLSDRKKPDYRNSIKESISAVESLCKTLTGAKGTLADAVKLLKPHPAFAKALSALYGFTSDADGIRHAIMEESNLTFSDAKFMLVACSAFVNYFTGKQAEGSLPNSSLPA